MSYPLSDAIVRISELMGMPDKEYSSYISNTTTYAGIAFNEFFRAVQILVDREIYTDDELFGLIIESEREIDADNRINLHDDGSDTFFHKLRFVGRKPDTTNTMVEYPIRLNYQGRKTEEEESSPEYIYCDLKGKYLVFENSELWSDSAKHVIVNFLRYLDRSMAVGTDLQTLVSFAFIERACELAELRLKAREAGSVFPLDSYLRKIKVVLLKTQPFNKQFIKPDYSRI
ncbi:MAG: hypothetical protein K8S56_09270 [Candidatus Cloacimonetes bacterium]|nr:hypothetical protein [Candidatus Cloacimonadota bacterium]